jgi:hypothetical protein
VQFAVGRSGALHGDDFEVEAAALVDQLAQAGVALLVGGSVDGRRIDPKNQRAQGVADLLDLADDGRAADRRRTRAASGR